jgi:hypothetical protein
VGTGLAISLPKSWVELSKNMGKILKTIGGGGPLRLCVCLSMKVNILHETPELVILVSKEGSKIICSGEFNL